MLACSLFKCNRKLEGVAAARRHFSLFYLDGQSPPGEIDHGKSLNLAFVARNSGCEPL